MKQYGETRVLKSLNAYFPSLILLLLESQNKITLVIFLFHAPVASETMLAYSNSLQFS